MLSVIDGHNEIDFIGSEFDGSSVINRVQATVVPATQWPVDSNGRSRGRSRMTVPEIADRLGLGRMAVYQLLKDGVIPAIRSGRRYIVTRHAYEIWERTCGNSDANSSRAG